MSRILRYELDVRDYQQVSIPTPCRMLSVAPGRGDYHIDLWVMVRETAPDALVGFHIFGTGHPMGSLPLLDFIGTCVMPDDLVWHVFVEPLL